MKNQIKILRKEIDELVDLSRQHSEKKFESMISDSKNDIISEIKRIDFKNKKAMGRGESMLMEEGSIDDWTII